MNIRKELLKLKDDKNAAFQARLTPGIDKKLFLGTRVPECRKLAKEIFRQNCYEEFINTLPHQYYDENILHSLIISEFTDYEKTIEELNRFLPYVDNWAVCDILKPKVFRKNKDRLPKQIKKWIRSEDTYTIRFGIEMLMNLYLDEDFD